jgi:hypothetical protein
MTSAELHAALEAEEVLAQELAGYAGLWVAVGKDRSIVDSATTFEELVTRVDPGGLDRILEVPRDAVEACLY